MQAVTGLGYYSLLEWTTIHPATVDPACRGVKFARRRYLKSEVAKVLYPPTPHDIDVPGNPESGGHQLAPEAPRSRTPGATTARITGPGPRVHPKAGRARGTPDRE